MAEVTQAITWEAPEHHHFEKGNDWYWVLWILAICGAVAAFFFGNFLFAILILIGAGSMALVAARQPAVIPFSVSTRGVRIGDKIYPYSTIESYYLDETNLINPQLLLKSKTFYLPLLIMPIPEEYIDDIEDLLRDRLPEEELEEPLVHKILEMFGF
jgi:hypothetical protein